MYEAPHVTSESIGESDVSPGGTRREASKDRHRTQKLTEEGVPTEKRGKERNRDKEGKSKKARPAHNVEGDEQG